jgi:hypothetical protein
MERSGMRASLIWKYQALILSISFGGECDDEELKPSLDRIDCDGHYADGHLQIVCKFVNRWKNNGSNAEFQ